VARAKLHHPLLCKEVVARGSLLDWLRDALRSHRLLVLSALQDRLE
jgi:hypothetical protein